MQTIINNTPVWITHRTGWDISDEEIEDYLGYAPDEREADEARNGALSGWYYCTCSPGCLPDSSFFGAYETEEQALDAANKFYND